MAYGPGATTKLVRLVGTNATIQDTLNERGALTDGWVFTPAIDTWDVTASTAAVATRAAAGDYNLTRTAGGAETHYFVGSPKLGYRILASKGVKLTDVVAVYSVATADATSVDLVVNQVTYVNAVANLVAAHGGAITYDAAHNTSALRKSSTGGVNPHVLVATLGTPVFMVTDKVNVTTELAVVLPNTAVFAFYGFGYHFTHDNL